MRGRVSFVVFHEGGGCPLSDLTVAFYGPMFELLGLGTAARAYVHALHSVGVDLTVINVTTRHTVRDLLVESLLNRNVEPDFHIFSWNPLSALPLRLVFDRLILQTVWETETIPEQWIPVLSDVREVWVPCSHNVAVFKKSLHTPIFRCPHAINPLSRSLLADMSKLPNIRESDFVVYSIFLWQERKNPFGIIAAFATAFPDQDDAVLILKTRSYWFDVNEVKHELTIRYKDANLLARIHIITDDWTEEQMEGLAQRGSCYISLHRGEGWCYPLFEAASRGIPVIATAYSGPLDYLDKRWHNFVQYNPTPVTQTLNETYDIGMMWAEPDVEQAARYLRAIYKDQQAARKKAAVGAGQITGDFSLERVGRIALDRLNALRQERSHMEGFESTGADD